MPDTRYWDLARQVCTDRQFEILELAYRFGFAQRTIAAQLDVSHSTVRSTLRRATQKVEIASRGKGDDA